METKPRTNSNSSSSSCRREDKSLKFPFAHANSDRLRRDEWSEGAVSSILEAYETKWVLRNRAKLKGSDWEDIARHVSSRANSSKSSKTQTQCKNKIESIKKRYRSEAASPEASSWALFPRLHLLLRCGPCPPLPHPVSVADPSAVPTPSEIRCDSPKGNGAKEKRVSAKFFVDELDKSPEKVDTSNLMHGGDKEKLKMTMITSKTKKKRKTTTSENKDSELAKSAEWLAEVMIKWEQASMDTMRELEKIREETQAKKAEMDLKRIKIVANTQLQIARLLADRSEGIETSLRIGRS